MDYRLSRSMAYGRSLTIEGSPAQAIHPVMLLINLRSLLAHTHHLSSLPAPPSPRSTSLALLTRRLRWSPTGHRPSATPSAPYRRGRVLPSFHLGLLGRVGLGLGLTWGVENGDSILTEIRGSGKSDGYNGRSRWWVNSYADRRTTP